MDDLEYTGVKKDIPNPAARAVFPSSLASSPRDGGGVKMGAGRGDESGNGEAGSGINGGGPSPAPSSDVRRERGVPVQGGVCAMHCFKVWFLKQYSPFGNLRGQMWWDRPHLPAQFET